MGGGMGGEPNPAHFSPAAEPGLAVSSMLNGCLAPASSGMGMAPMDCRQPWQAASHPIAAPPHAPPPHAPPLQSLPPPNGPAGTMYTDGRAARGCDATAHRSAAAAAEPALPLACAQQPGAASTPLATPSHAGTCHSGTSADSASMQPLGAFTVLESSSQTLAAPTQHPLPAKPPRSFPAKIASGLGTRVTFLRIVHVIEKLTAEREATMQD